ncbi:hypothetical protein [Erythrobacter rubeus]|uniref:Uncharacterized protein n=1 Tax=Erythrobacter rubeus TaxID=2760803 RepID=A0ABR8KTJ1_9SPHN|nr:hypothetical protein [Erythrobacter rubeus]MBD2842675.1 hypothetical protein [Erythrobacter rubeus]
MTTSTKRTITEADREACNTFIRDGASIGVQMQMAGSNGQRLLEAFARHREQSIATLGAENKALREAIGKADEWFNEYAVSHADKMLATDDPEERRARQDKANRNAKRSHYMRKALAK